MPARRRTGAAVSGPSAGVSSVAVSSSWLSVCPRRPSLATTRCSRRINRRDAVSILTTVSRAILLLWADGASCVVVTLVCWTMGCRLAIFHCDDDVDNDENLLRSDPASVSDNCNYAKRLSSLFAFSTGCH